MSLYVTSLNSGSNGNCYYIGNEQEAVLVDAGISCRETEKRMGRLGLKMDKVKAIFISHEHGDHIRGVEGLAAKHCLPVYITAGTLRHSRLRIAQELVNSFAAYQPVQIGALQVCAFPKRHDAADPHSFVINGNNVNIGVFTDIGSTCEHVIKNFRQCNAIFLEANYDEAMLENGRYPHHLKNRIKGGHGHLSNMQALLLLTSHRHSGLSHIFLSHLSRDNNEPSLALNLFRQHAGATHIVIASRYEETAIYHIAATGHHKMLPKVKAVPRYVQATLF